MPYLLKTEPDVYSISDLERDHETIWDGVSNPQAVGLLAKMTAGEKLVIYHTGKEKQAVGLALVISVDAEDPKQPKVRIRFEGKLKTPRTLAAMKEHKLFAGSPLIKQGRLGVVPLSEAQYGWIAEK